MKTLDVVSSEDLKEKVSDVEVYGNPDVWQLISKASSKSQGWMKSTKAMDVHGGCLIQVSTQQRALDGTYSVAEAVAFVPGQRASDLKHK